MIDRNQLFLPSYRRSHKIIKDAVLVDAPLFSGELSTEYLQLLATEINNELRITGKTKVVFCQESEGFASSNLSNFNTTSKFINSSDIAILSGAIHTETNVKLYGEYVKKNDWPIKQYWFTNSWENVCSSEILLNLETYEKINNTFSKKSKKALCFIRAARPHRLCIISNLLKENLIDQCIVSCYTFTKNDMEVDPNQSAIARLVPTIAEDIVETLKKHIDKFPMELTLKSNWSNIFNILDDVSHYENSYFSIVPESKFFHDDPNSKNNLHEITMDVIMLSEKTYKPISAKHPFILASYPGSLKALRGQGYQTFHPFIDESYDLIENDEERIIAVNKEISRLCNLTDVEWELMYSNLLPILHHNYNLLKKATFVANKVDYNEYQ